MHDETAHTLKMMQKYGINNVRGGPFVTIKLSQTEYNAIAKMLNHDNNKCFRCGGDHYVSKCPINSKSTKYNPKCVRCGRNNHTISNCYAKTHINGKTLTPKSYYDHSDASSDSDDESWAETIASIMKWVTQSTPSPAAESDDDDVDNNSVKPPMASDLNLDDFQIVSSGESPDDLPDEGEMCVIS